MKFEKIKSDFSFSSPSEMDLGVEMPSYYRENFKHISEITLPDPGNLKMENLSFSEILTNRRSVRAYDNRHISKRELSYILKKTAAVEKSVGSRIFKPTPSGGARHPLDVYVAIINVLDMEKGIYYYHPLNHSLFQISRMENIREELVNICNGQSFVKNANFLYIIGTNPNRTAWKYKEMTEKLVLLDAGHLGHHLMLVATSMNMGSCPIASYNQAAFDQLLQLDGEKEMVTYVFPVGKRKNI